MTKLIVRILPLLRILGIDPGSRVTGYGVIEIKSGNLVHLDHGCIRMPNGTMGARLLKLSIALEKVIQRVAPTEVAIEKVFVGANAESALKLGHARGVAILTASKYGLSISEYSPNQIKKTVVGRGHADKNQMKFMIRILLKLPRSPASDAADALAAAICHCNTGSFNSKLVKASGK